MLSGGPGGSSWTCSVFPGALLSRSSQVRPCSSRLAYTGQPCWTAAALLDCYSATATAGTVDQGFLSPRLSSGFLVYESLLRASIMPSIGLRRKGSGSELLVIQA